MLGATAVQFSQECSSVRNVFRAQGHYFILRNLCVYTKSLTVYTCVFSRERAMAINLHPHQKFLCHFQYVFVIIIRDKARAKVNTYTGNKKVRKKKKEEEQRVDAK